MGPAEQPPEAMIAFVARQLGVRHVGFANYAQRDQTRREHAVELQRYLGLRSFELMDWRACLRVGADAAWATDRGEPIVQAMLAHLRISGVVLPPATVASAGGGNALSRALRALGRIERTLFTLQWLSDPVLRQRSHAGLNKGEASNALRRAVFFHRQGKSEIAPSKIRASVRRA
jgi:TnpA family transposase